MTRQSSFLFVFLMAIMVIAGINDSSPAEAGTASATMTVTATVVAPEDLGPQYLVVSATEVPAGAAVTGNTAMKPDSCRTMCRILQVSLVSTGSSCVRLQFYSRGTYLPSDLLYSHSGEAEWHDQMGGLYHDSESGTSAELHWKLINCGTAPATVKFELYSTRLE